EVINVGWISRKNIALSKLALAYVEALQQAIDE
ncbi:LysR family transcriptional regulator, partial [Paenibacillus anaericanus]